jgi:hypothetical protein
MPLPYVPSAGAMPAFQPPVLTRSRIRANQDVTSGYPAPTHPVAPPVVYTLPGPTRGDGGATAGGTHIRYPYYNYRSPWTYGGPASFNHDILW